MGFERADSVFSCIEVMNFGQDELLVQLPNVFNDIFVLFAGFIVQYLEINYLITVLSQVMISFYERSRCESFRDSKGAKIMVLEFQ